MKHSYVSFLFIPFLVGIGINITASANTYKNVASNAPNPVCNTDDVPIAKGKNAYASAALMFRGSTTDKFAMTGNLKVFSNSSIIYNKPFQTKTTISFKVGNNNMQFSTQVTSGWYDNDWQNHKSGSSKPSTVRCAIGDVPFSY